ncbi:NB-ARC domain-containing protein [Streptomyces sp. BK340]|uniref:NB-ARC domain-containing protein n=1 Tax=Streptomyces sp. BK340 TaxID=2572903 RepID=UPI001648936A|nr:NB-ARC domain-containing protein [Streptomyces sp. BK340]
MESQDHVDFRGSTFHERVTGKVEHHHHIPASTPTATSALPAPPATFTGRDEYVEDLLKALDPTTSDSHGAVLICAVGGLGGVGKTALALHAAHAVRARFPGGTLFVNMRGYDDAPAAPEEVALSFLRAFGVRDEHLPAVSEERYALYRSVLDTHESVLIVLDNVSTAAQVTPLLPGSTRHRVLVTTRDSLDSLTARSIQLGALSPDEAVGLVEQSLRARNPSDSRVRDEPDSVRRLVALCGCLPLALLIAAALLHRRRPRPISMLADELQAAADRVRMLAAPGQDQYGTQLALRPVFEVTYQRLGPEQGRLFRLLAQTPTSDFGFETALAMSNVPSEELLQGLDDLVAASLITPSPDGDRWDMHDLLRAYASSISTSEQSLVEEATEGRTRLLRRLFLLAASADRQLHGQLVENTPDLFANREAALTWLDAEHASLVHAALWAEQAEHSRIATALGVCIDRYLHVQRHFTDGALVFDALLAAARRDRDQVLEMFALSASGNHRHELRQYREAAIAHTKALRLAYSLEDLSGQATGWSNLGRCMHRWGQFSIAAQMHSHARKLFSRLGDHHREAMAWNNLGMPLTELHRFEEAGRALGSAQQAYARLGDRQREATAWLNLGATLKEGLDFDAAANAYMNAAELFAEQGDRHGEATAWSQVGSLLTDLQEFELAAEGLLRCETAYEALGEWFDVGRVRWNIALLHEQQGKRLEARAAWIASAEAYERAQASEEAAKARRNAQL